MGEAKIGIIFGTDTGYTRRIAKMIAKELGPLAGKPVNINRISVDEFLSYDTMILGTPTYGEGALPGVDTGIAAGSWAEFLPQLEGRDLTGKTIALYGFGDQNKYAFSFVSAMGRLYHALREKGATVIAKWPVADYKFDSSAAVVDGQFVGLALDEKNQGHLTSSRVSQWLDLVKQELPH